MSRLKQLYQDMILDHNRNPRHFEKMNNASHVSHGHNPLCGDDYYVYVKLNNHNIIENISFDGAGCAISKSSGSLMTQTIIGKPIEEVLKIKNLFLKLVTEGLETNETTQIGKLKIFEGVREFPARVKCAALVWRALENALEQTESNTFGEITTE